MGLLVDTSVFVEAERRRLALPTIVELASAEEPIAVAAVTIAELLVGVHLGRPQARRLQRQAFIAQVIRDFPVLPFGIEVARTYAQVWADLRRSGNVIPPHDLMIACTAACHGLEVLTHNLREFQRIPGLTLRAPNW